jgi:hypothetical protein
MPANSLSLADGFYRLCINPAGIPELSVIFPTKTRRRTSGSVSSPAHEGLGQLASLRLCRQGDCCGPRQRPSQLGSAASQSHRLDADADTPPCLPLGHPRHSRPPKTSPGPVIDTSTPVEAFGSRERPSRVRRRSLLRHGQSPLAPNYLDTQYILESRTKSNR